MRRLAIAIGLAAGLAGCGGGQAGTTTPSTSAPAPAGASSFDAARAFGDLRDQVALGARPTGSAANRRNAELIAAGLRKAGAQDVGIQHPYRNVVGRLPGTSPGAIVVGAHFDTKEVPGFVGANDGASGVGLLLELARDLAPSWQGPELDFAFFDAEEAPGPSNSARAFIRSGDRGSRQYVRYAQSGEQGTPQLGSIQAMVLFDMVGDCDLQIPFEANSNPDLYRLFAANAKGASPFHGSTEGVLDDDTPFQKAGIPAVDLIDFHYGPGPPPGAYYHTTGDNLDHVCASSLGEVGSASLAALRQIAG